MKSIAAALAIALFVCVTVNASDCDRLALDRARESAKIAGYSLSKIQRWLHEVALKRIDPKTGLYRPEGDYNYRDAWADCYPFLAWAAWTTDLEAFNGPVREALRAEQKHCKPRFFSEPGHIFGGSEYVKDGLVAIVEATGRQEWVERMKDIECEIWRNPRVVTDYGRIPSKSIEVNGEQLQVLARLYTMTGQRKYLNWAERIGDYYLMPRRFVPKRLRDHGCEILGGLSLLLGVESTHNSAKAKEYIPAMRKMLDRILDEGVNEDGIMFNNLGKRDGLSDGWGYNYTAFLVYDMVTARPVYRDQITRTLRNLAKPLYNDYPWEPSSNDGYADSIEGAIYIVNRIAAPEAMAWVDRETDRRLANSNEPLESAKLWGSSKTESNVVRTVIMHALTHTRGLLARPWRQDLSLGGSETKDGLAVIIKAEKDWNGKVVFDIPRHRMYMGFKKDWPRINALPEWFTVEPDKEYVVRNLANGRQETYTGEQLHEGLPVRTKAGKETALVVGDVSATHKE